MKTYVVLDLTKYIDQIKDSQEDFIVIHREVDPVYELTAVTEKLIRVGRNAAVMFNRVRGSRIPVLINLFAARGRIARALATNESGINEAYRLGEARPISPIEIDKRLAPVKDVMYLGNDASLIALPIVHHNEHDSGKFITGGALIVRDPETGTYNTGIYRHMLKGPRKLGIAISPTSHCHLIHQKYVARNEPMPVAIVIGHHPLFYLGILSFAPMDVDELGVVGGLMKQPLRMTQAETIDLKVPADAEIVIEGVIYPGEEEPEGPFGEYTGLYGAETVSPVIHVQAITHRRNPTYLDVYAASLDHQLLGGIPRLSYIHRTVAIACPTVKEVHVPLSAYGRLACYVSIQKRHEGEPKNAALAAFTADPFLRYVIVTDHDVNVTDESQVMRAVYTYVEPESDVSIIKNAKGHFLDPGVREGNLATKVLIDATKPVGTQRVIAEVPGVDEIDLDNYLPSE